MRRNVKHTHRTLWSEPPVAAEPSLQYLTTLVEELLARVKELETASKELENGLDNLWSQLEKMEMA